MPIGAQHNYGRFAAAGVVVFRFFVEFQVIAIAQVAFYHVIKRGSIVASVERCLVIGVILF